MTKFLIFLHLILVSNLYSFELKCTFEEVYSDGTVQNGFFLMKNKKLRYEYNSDDLFTIFHNHGKFFLVKNNNKEIISTIDENTEIIKELLNIANNFPNVEEEYMSENLNIKLEKNAQGNFFKRIWKQKIIIAK